jgi:serine/threonine protein kinase
MDLKKLNGITLKHKRYTLRTRITNKESGQGAVFRARDTIRRRNIAIKILLPENFADPTKLARFKQEMKILESLWSLTPGHHIIPILDYSEEETIQASDDRQHTIAYIQFLVPLIHLRLKIQVVILYHQHKRDRTANKLA